jgi:Fe-S-cluster-containing dehydrogenase component/formate-dependent nitrite reductase membrane component NrfD
MRYGFVIDQDRCIGCHACTVACKEEHDVPLGVFRTWVKYIEKGEFPDTRRHFGVMRCNHCDAAPCVAICPTSALYVADNGVVDFDNQRCIGCKACMQACPYDALYIDPATHTAAKCNFCNHRLEQNLEPACVIVCPTEAILTGDLDDPKSTVSHIVAEQKVVSRKTHKATKPKLFYIGIEGDLLEPAASAPLPAYMWSDRQPGEKLYSEISTDAPLPRGSREVYNVAHPAPWGWKIAAYLWTKSIAAGALLVAAALLGLNFGDEHGILYSISPIIALAFCAITAFLLVIDLKRPKRFYYLLTKPNFKSWVVIGAYILGIYGLFALLWIAARVIGGSPPPWLMAIASALAAATACYTGFLFAQAKGRDLWQTRLFLWHLLVQAMLAGSAVLIVAGVAAGADFQLLGALEKTMVAALLLSFVMILTELYGTHASVDVELATRLIRRGALSTRFWGLAIALGVAAPVVLIAVGGQTPAMALLAALAALAGLWIYENVWVAAGQAPPLS